MYVRKLPIGEAHEQAIGAITTQVVLSTYNIVSSSNLFVWSTPGSSDIGKLGNPDGAFGIKFTQPEAEGELSV